MAKKGYIGINNKAQPIKKIYIGIDNKARKVKKAYIGDINNKAKQWYASEVEIFANGITSPLAGSWTPVGYYEEPIFDSGIYHTENKVKVTSDNCLTGSVEQKGGNIGGFRSTKMIDVTKFKTLTFEIKSNYCNGEQATRLGLISNTSPYISGNVPALCYIGNGGKGTYKVNISNLSGSYYIFSEFFSWTAFAEIKISKITLS